MKDEKKCGNCKYCTFRFNKVWCDIKSQPYPQNVCEHWEPQTEDEYITELIKKKCKGEPQTEGGE